MLLRYPKVDKRDKTVEVLNDLLKINSDRIAGYQMALDQSKNIDPGIRAEFKKIVSDGIGYRQQLIDTIARLNGDAKTGTTFFGKIYRAWTDLKVTFSVSTQKSVIASCIYNEEIALQVYNAALNLNIAMSDDIKELIEAQEKELRATHSHIRKYREARQMTDFRLVYFN